MDGPGHVMVAPMVSLAVAGLGIGFSSRRCLLLPFFIQCLGSPVSIVFLVLRLHLFLTTSCSLLVTLTASRLLSTFSCLLHQLGSQLELTLQLLKFGRHGNVIILARRLPQPLVDQVSVLVVGGCHERLMGKVLQLTIQKLVMLSRDVGAEAGAWDGLVRIKEDANRIINTCSMGNELGVVLVEVGVHLG